MAYRKIMGKDGLYEKRSRMRLIDFPRHDANPFTERVALKILEDSGMRQIMGSGGLDASQFARIEQHIVDRERFTKIFISQVQTFFRLTDRASKLFYVITRMLEKDRTEITLLPWDMVKYMDCSEKTYYRALQELVTYEILAKSRTPHTFFINSNYVHNGDRINIVKSYLLDKREEQEIEHTSGSAYVQQKKKPLSLKERRKINDD